MNTCKANFGELGFSRDYFGGVGNVVAGRVRDPLKFLNTRTHSKVCMARSGYKGAASRSLYSMIFELIN